MTPSQWQALIQADPGLQLIENQLSAGDVGNLDQRNAGIQSALTTFGGPVDLARIAAQLGLSTNDLQGLDSKTIQALAQEADQSGVSTSARLAHANDMAIAGIKSTLASRGLLRSSALNNELGEQNQNFTNAEFDAHQKLLSALQQYQQGYLAYKQQQAQQLAQGVNDAANRVSSQYGGQTQDNGPQTQSQDQPPVTPPPPSLIPGLFFNPTTGRLQPYAPGVGGVQI